ncbi:MAG: hypothetical protein V1872_09420 [bacterium]
MALKNNFKEKLIKEINEFPEDKIDSIYQILHCLRIEFTKKEIKRNKTFSERFINTFGSWKDKRSTKNIVEEIYNSRCFIEKDIKW